MIRHFACALGATFWLGITHAGALVVQSFPLAGFSHHAANALWPQLREGDLLTMRVEQDNPHDSQAVSLCWQEQRIGYLPRHLNGAVSRALSTGRPLEARIAKLRWHPDPRRRIEVEVRYVFPASIEKQ